MNINTTIEDQQDDRAATGQAIDVWIKAIGQLGFGLCTYVAAVPVWCWVAIGAPICVTSVICYVLWHRGISLTLKRCIGRCRIFPITDEGLMAIPRPEENIQRTFVGVLSSETPKKLQAMFRKNFCPEISSLAKGTELNSDCRLLICCLIKDIRKMYLNGDTVFTKLIEDAGSLQAMVLIIIFGEKKTPEETLHDEKIYGNVLRQGRELYMKGRRQTSQLKNRCQDNPGTTENGDGLSENIALVTVDSRPSWFQLEFMKNFVERAFPDTRVSDEYGDHQV